MWLCNRYGLLGFEGGAREDMKIPSGITGEKVGTTRRKYYVTFGFDWCTKISGVYMCFQIAGIPYLNNVRYLAIIRGAVQQ